ncbi:DUF3047 domain-containing protein [Marinobacter halotolerans]|uniref:DUF3047 domain-containing protein n=1 Tax=Marinobacter halotolerans TaxID=1569211 RepID=UPI0012451DA3|nr:DUF3047 domain-containing protein [Marinobacter halotolerans]
MINHRLSKTGLAACLVLLLAAVYSTLAFPQNEKESLLKPFSTATSLAPEWEELKFPNIDRLTRYTLVTENGQQAVMASTDNSASGLIARIRVEPGEKLMLRWRWKISSVYENGNARRKSGDDYPARIYVAFEFEPDKAGFFERAKRQAAALVFGQELPGNALNYIWANQLDKGTLVANPFTDTTMMIAVESGNDKAGQWLSAERDIVADYRRAFGAEPPAIVGVAIMSDSDNTGASARAWYGDVTLTREHR